jgi:protein-tyrosine phosphatase
MYNQAWIAASVAQAHVMRGDPLAFTQDAIRWYRATPANDNTVPRTALAFVKEDVQRWWSEPTTVSERVLLSSVDLANDRTRLKEMGVTHICNATGDLPRFYKCDFTYHKTGWFDDNKVTCTPAQYREAFDFIHHALESDPKAIVLIHCAAGRSRSASIVLYYLCRTYKLSLSEAMIRLYDARSVVMINERFVACVAQTLAQDAADGSDAQQLPHNHHHALLLNDFVLQR